MPASILYSYNPVGAVTTIVPVATEHVGCVVLTLGAAGGVQIEQGGVVIFMVVDVEFPEASVAVMTTEVVVFAVNAEPTAGTEVTVGDPSQSSAAVKAGTT